MSEATQSSETPQNSPDFYLVFISEFDAPQLLTFNSPEQVAQAIREFKVTNKKFFAYVFEGRLWQSTKGKNNYLLSPDADARYPLFDEQTDTINENGFFE